MVFSLRGYDRFRMYCYPTEQRSALGVGID
jgi:hypothetical protein